MIKTYKSTSVLSFSITMPAGNYRRIRFTPFSWGGGVYVTEDEAEQKVLESIPEFGNRFVLVSAEGASEEEAVNADEQTSAGEDTIVNDNTEVVDTPKEDSANEVEVADFGEAKEYLMEHYGYKSGQLRSQKSISEAAEKNGIVFVYA